MMKNVISRMLLEIYLSSHIEVIILLLRTIDTKIDILRLC